MGGKKTKYCNHKNEVGPSIHLYWYGDMSQVHTPKKSDWPVAHTDFLISTAKTVRQIFITKVFEDEAVGRSPMRLPGISFRRMGNHSLAHL